VDKTIPDARPPVGVKKLALGEITGDSGQILAQEIAFNLPRFQGLAITPLAEAQAVLSGSVETRVNDQTGLDLIEAWRKTKGVRRVDRSDPFVGRTFSTEEPVYDAIVEQTPFVWRRSSMRFRYTLIDTGGRVLQPETDVAVSSSIKYGGINETSRFGPELDDLPSRREVIRDLARSLAEKVAIRLTPVGPKIDIILDTGEGPLGEPEIRRGVRLAESNLWEQAVAAWRKVLEDDPEHPAALYNLGASYERLGGLANLKTALDMYAKAAHHGNRPLYRQALTRLTVAVRELERPPSD